MFSRAKTFNQYIGGIDVSWNTRIVMDMFERVVSFNQALPWNVRSYRIRNNMFAGSKGCLI